MMAPSYQCNSFLYLKFNLNFFIPILKIRSYFVLITSVRQCVKMLGNSPSGKKNWISRSALVLLSLPCTALRSSSVPNTARKLHKNTKLI